MMTRDSLLRTLAGPVIALALASCADLVRPSAAVEAPGAAALSASSGSTLLECPIDVTRSDTATVGLSGGVLEVDGHRVVIPANTVLVPTRFSLIVPVSNYMEVWVRAGSEEHYQFSRPVSLTISYARCTRSNIEKQSLRIFHTDESSKAILEDMGGTDDKTARTVTTTTDHLSGYTIGGN
ncbi:MAG TPA: hypothetical protein VHG28_20260 [Longimicrobiaceae bacterium]|nr:hypothetical protein [Longimicrobiaceae bacterium]